MIGMEKNRLFYRGFKGTVNFSEKENLFYGQVTGIDDLLTFEGESIKALEAAFHNMVDDHIRDCELEDRQNKKMKVIQKMRSIKIIAVNAAAERGPKFPVDELDLMQDGIEGDVHAGTSRPVSMFNMAEAERFYQITGAHKLERGRFAENILFESDDEIAVRPFDRFEKDEVVLQVTQKGKPFHDRFREPGNYVMPREGIFCRVLSGRKLKAGETMTFQPKVFKARIITLSDRASRGIYQDKSGPAITGMLEKYFRKLDWRLETENIIIPDNEKQLEETLHNFLTQGVDIIITTGGTGIGPRDITPEVMQKFIEKEIPGIMEMIRWKYGVEKPAALTSRALAGVNNKTLLFALPGSVRAVNEYMTEILKHLEHLFYMIEGVDRH